MRFTSIVAAGLLAGAATASPVKASPVEARAVQASPVQARSDITSLIDTLKKDVVTWAEYVESELKNLTKSLTGTRPTYSRPNLWSSPPKNKYLDWKTFKANGVNLGNWLLLEYSSNQDWWNEKVPSTVAKDEWHFCEYLGKKCGPLMEKHYATYYTFADIDKLAAVGVNLLRVPMTYQAWVNVKGSKLYHGAQLVWFKRLTDYAITRHGMHIVIDLHSLPGSCNGLDNGEAIGHYNWWFNQTNMDYTLQMIEKAATYIDLSGHPESYTLSLINEAITDADKIGTNETVSTEGVQYMLEYLNSSRTIMDKINPNVPIMWQDSWMGEKFWSALLPEDPRIVLDLHIYYFTNLFSNAYSKYFTYSVCGAADYFAGDKKYPVFVGEWSDEILYNNSLSDRKTNFDTQRYAYALWGSGSAFWSDKQYGNENVSGEGIRSDYWCYDCMLSEGVITEATTQSYC